MAVDVVYSDHFVGMNSISSPSFSFSNDLNKSNPNNNPICRFPHSLPDSSSFDFDFAFNVDTSISFQSSTADELFSNGKILPTSVKKEVIVKKIENEILSVPRFLGRGDKTRFDSSKKSLKEFLDDSSSEEEKDSNSEVSTTKSFWKFRRSNSLNCDGNQKKGLIGSWKILSRSGSTGKFLEKILKETEDKKPGFFRKFSRNNSLSSRPSSEVLRRSNSTSNDYVANPDIKSFRRSKSTGSALNHGRNKKFQPEEQFIGNVVRAKSSTQKGQIKNGKLNDFGGYYSNNKSVKINQVLNLPSPYISRISVDLFGIGSLFCNGSVKDKKRRK